MVIFNLVGSILLLLAEMRTNKSNVLGPMVLYGNSIQTKAWKSHFLTSWPWPLTLIIELVQDAIKVNSPGQFLCPYVKFFDHERAYRQTHAQTDRKTGPILLPRLLTRKVKNYCQLKMLFITRTLIKVFTKNFGSVDLLSKHMGFIVAEPLEINPDLTA